MHELGIIIHVDKTLQEVAKENNITEIGSVTLEVGEVSGIVSSYLTDAWSYFTKDSQLLKHSKLLIESLPAVTYCNNCHESYATIKFGKECPYCHSNDTYLIKGNECNIKEIEAY